MQKTDDIRIRVSPEEKQAFDAAAKAAKLRLSDWVRTRLWQAVESEKRKGKKL